MMNRRRFLQSLAAAASAPAVTSSCAASDVQFGALLPDDQQLLDLPEGFELTVISRVGDTMADGFKIPPAHDGMAAFEGDDGRIILICNHEMESSWPEYNAYGPGFNDLPDETKHLIYDWGGGETPGAGGTTTTIYNPATRKVESQFLSLGGTEINCAGGPTPWGSWLSCEESFSDPGAGFNSGRRIVRDEKHGYVFEVPARADGLVEALPLKEMGRFEHEACAVHEPTGIVYMTEDRHHSLFYRFIPNVPGKLREGGRLQALAFEGEGQSRTHNWGSEPNIELNTPVACPGGSNSTTSIRIAMTYGFAAPSRVRPHLPAAKACATRMVSSRLPARSAGRRAWARCSGIRRASSKAASASPRRPASSSLSPSRTRLRCFVIVTT